MSSNLLYYWQIIIWDLWWCSLSWRRPCFSFTLSAKALELLMYKLAFEGGCSSREPPRCHGVETQAGTLGLPWVLILPTRKRGNNFSPNSMFESKVPTWALNVLTGHFLVSNVATWRHSFHGSLPNRIWIKLLPSHTHRVRSRSTLLQSIRFT